MNEVFDLAPRIEVDGFAVIERLFAPGEIDAVSEALARAPLPRSRAGARHAMHNPVVADLARDSRLMRIAQGVLGAQAVPFRATLFDKSPNANWLVVWHQDTALPLWQRHDAPGWGPWSVKSGVTYAHAPSGALNGVLALRIHLDDCRTLNGPLRVLPGTHRMGVLTDETVSRLSRESEPFECIVARGGVVAMRPLIVHASSKSQTEAARRVVHIEYASATHAGHGLELAVA